MGNTYRLGDVTFKTLEAKEKLILEGALMCIEYIGKETVLSLKKRRDESWVEFSNRMFINHRIDSDEWQWCFEASWVHTDNSRHGAAQRIIWLLQYGLPDNWKRQMHGWDGLCYTELESFCESFVEEHV